MTKPEFGPTIESETHSWTSMRHTAASHTTSVGSIASRRRSAGLVAAFSWASLLREASCLRFPILSALPLPPSSHRTWRSYSASSVRLPEANGITQSAAKKRLIGGMANHALQRTAAGRHCCTRCVPCAGSLSLGR